VTVSDARDRTASDHTASDHTASTTAAVRGLYDTYPFPPEPILDEPPPGYNWRWSWTAAHQFCTGRGPDRQDIRILDAGCGTGVGTEYLMHLNPQAQITAIDLSSEALAIAQERHRRTGKPEDRDRVQFRHMSLYDAAELPGQFDLINCVGVLHHLPDPIRGIQALAAKLAPGGLMHIFVYGELGRWEIQLMQEAIALLGSARTDGDESNPYRDGVQIGRALFSALPDNNRLVQRERDRWSLENQRDECFADMYVHPQEIDYNLNSLFDLIDASGLDFLGFSNPQIWQLDRLIAKAPHLIERASRLDDRQRYRLIELLDPEAIAHYEFFLAKPPRDRQDWSDDGNLAAAIATLNPCLDGWPGATLFNADYQIIRLDPDEQAFLEQCDRPNPSPIGEILPQLNRPALNLDRIRQLIDQRLLILTPPKN